MEHLQSYLDHTLLIPTANTDAIKALCDEAITNEFKAICINPYFASFASKILAESDVKLATVAGFPFGYNPTVAKAAEIKWAIDHGADEIDAVVNIAALKSGEYSFVRNDIETIVRSVTMRGKTIKMIVEASILTEDELKRVLEYCVESGVHYIKNSSGYQGDGASVDMIQKLRSMLPTDIKIKASGGIKSKRQAIKLIEAGADRIGSSACLNIIK